jgi:hypothetical protein
MKVIETLRKERDSCCAVIEVAEQEVADIDAMAMMIDGQGGDYSVDARLVSTDDPPNMQNVGGQRLPLRQSHFSRPNEIRDQRRFYEVRLNRN